MKGFHCDSCGQYHDYLPLSYGVHAPIYWSDEVARHPGSELGKDTCVINGEHFFIRGNVEIPVRDSEEVFAYSIWVSLSQQSYERILQRWNDPNRDEDEPYFGWFSCRLMGYPDTLNLKAMVHTRQIGFLPFIELEPTDHPLAIEQSKGITLKQVKELAELYLHPD